MNWAPNQAFLSSVLSLLKNSTNPNNAIQNSVQQQLKQESTNPEFILYLAFVFSYSQEPVHLKQVAGVLLKNSIKKHYFQLPSTVLDYVKSSVLQSLHSVEVLKMTGASVIALIVDLGSLSNWINVLEQLASNLTADNTSLLSGTLTTLLFLSEDCVDELTAQETHEFQCFLFPKLISFLSYKEGN